MLPPLSFGPVQSQSQLLHCSGEVHTRQAFQSVAGSHLVSIAFTEKPSRNFHLKKKRESVGDVSPTLLRKDIKIVMGGGGWGILMSQFYFIGRHNDFGH